jgi:hypothetical protein
MMTVDQLPPAGQPVRFCPPGTTPSDWIEAELIESKRRLLGPRMVRLSFRNPFPYETFKNVVYGSAKVGGLAPSATWAPEKGRDYR